MQRSALKKKANNLNDLLAIKLYKKQRNYVVNLSQKLRKTIFRNICQFCKPFFTNQITNFDDKIMLVEKKKREETISFQHILP